MKVFFISSYIKGIITDSQLLHTPLNTAVNLKIAAINNNFPCTWLNLSNSFYISLQVKELINELFLAGLPQWPPAYTCLPACLLCYHSQEETSYAIMPY